jgi:voltage-gated potassium channel Kch
MKNALAEEIKQEWDIARRQVFVTGIAAVGLLSAGATFFHISEKLSWIDSFYFCTISLATVGYGDITPKTDAQKIFIIFYVLLGIGVIATFANLVIKSGSLRREYRRAKRVSK